MRLRIPALLAMAAVPLALAACGGGNNPTGGVAAAGSGCPAPSGTSGNGAHVSIGSKDFSEEQILASMTQQVLQAHGFTVDYTFQAADKAIGTALTSGNIDMYWQYTGTEITDYLGYTTGQFPTDLNQAFAFAKQKDAPRGICWTAEAPFDDTNGIAIKASQVGTYGSTLSAFGTYLASHPQTSICIMAEFRTRPDGLPGLEKTYNQSYGSANLVTIGNTAEDEIANGQCDAGEVFTTDAKIKVDGLYVLQDDKKLFPPDNVGLLVRESVLQQHPAIAALMAPVAAKLDTATMLSLDAMVDAQGQKPSDVAHTWLVQNGFLSS
ncbi:MAG TPA: glycine betaine ABC transporter substrate-binding protein [Candidatus Binatia bacterium]|nr:glycine betaine ABC transporter substrate-binding protein [Candidatus Binatia bacterium]